jgi:hypothetical protein
MQYGGVQTFTMICRDRYNALGARYCFDGHICKVRDLVVSLKEMTGQQNR